jgi:C1A family cysteine protease
MSKLNRKYPLVKQNMDHRDYPFHMFAARKNLSLSATLPTNVSNRKYCSYVEDQGDLGSCTANAWAGLIQYNHIKDGFGGKVYRDMSRLFIYYNERVIEGTVDQDAGAQLRTGAQTLASQGVCTEGSWKYIESEFTVKPLTSCYTSALSNTIHSYYALNTLQDMKTCLAAGQCFVFGFSVYDAFESQQVADTGILNLPTPSEENLVGHAVLAVGYDDSTQRILVKNSWGLGWGLPGNLSGYFTMPYAYITDPNLAMDYWTVALH